MRNGSLRTKVKPIAKGSGLIALRYEETVAAKAPIAVTVAPPREPPVDTHPALRSPVSRQDENENENKRDSGLAPTTTSSKAAREGSLNSASVEENVLGFTINFNSSPTIAIALADTAQTTSEPPITPTSPKVVKKSYSMSGSRWRRPTSKGSRKGDAPQPPTSAGKDAEEQFSPITTDIPTDSLLDADFLKTLSFSKRGSVMLGGRKAVNGHARPNGGRR